MCAPDYDCYDRKEEKMERMKNMVARVWKGFCRVIGGRVFAAVLMCVVTLSMMMGASSHTRVFTVIAGDKSRVMVTMSDTPYLTLDGGDSIWVHAPVEEDSTDATVSVEIFADGQSTLLTVPEGTSTVTDVIEQAGVTMGELDQTNVDKDAVVTDGMLVQVDRVDYEEYTVTQAISYQTVYRYSCVLKPGNTKVDVYGKNGEKVITYRKNYVNGELVSEEKVGEEITKKAKDQVILKGSAYGSPISNTPSNVTINLDSKNQPVSYKEKIYGS